MAGHGGARPGAGRKSAKHEYVDDGELSPLQYLLKVMRNPRTPRGLKIECAAKAAPYCHARLQHITGEVDQTVDLHLISYADATPDQLALNQSEALPVARLAGNGAGRT